MERLKALFLQMFRFGVTGGICFLIDYFLMVFLTEIVGLYYLISNIVSFTVSTVVNYLLSMHFVFEGKKDVNRWKEFTEFTVLSCIGLGMNTLLMWLFTSRAGWHYMVSKIIVTAIVMIYNFISRKLLLEENISNE